MEDKVVFLPFYGEFGWMVISHLRHVHRHAAKEKIVCCEPGQRCLFPSATGFFFDWRNPLDDSERCCVSSLARPRAADEADAGLREALVRRFPDHRIIRSRPYFNPWEAVHAVRGVELKLKVEPALPSVDVVISARRRDFTAYKNWLHWEVVLEALREKGLCVGLAGARETSFDLPCDALAWDHPDGQTAGTVDLLSRCGVYLGTDSGVSHLAALMSTPSIVFRQPMRQRDLRDIMRGASRGFFHALSDSAWDQPRAVIDAVLTVSAVRTEPREYPRRIRSFRGDAGRTRHMGVGMVPLARAT